MQTTTARPEQFSSCTGEAALLRIIAGNRCDARLPSCTTCEKVNARCVGYDPITKREIPRSYVYFLETRLGYFESLLKKNNIAYEPSETYDADSRLLGDATHTPPKQDSKATIAERRNGNKNQDEKDKIDLTRDLWESRLATTLEGAAGHTHGWNQCGTLHQLHVSSSA